MEGFKIKLEIKYMHFVRNGLFKCGVIVCVETAEAGSKTFLLPTLQCE